MATLAENARPSSRRQKSIARKILEALASLKLTVALFVIGIVIVFIGTLAQTEMNEFQVTQRIFYANVFWVKLQYFFPPSFFPALAGKVSGSFPFFGGWAIAVAMSVNLIAAHMVRFTVQGKGTDRMIGLGISAVGAAVLYAVIQAGHNKGGLQGEPPVSWDAIWYFMVGTLVIGWFVSLAGCYMCRGSKPLQFLLSVISAIALTGGMLTVFGFGWRLHESALRIVWQLSQGALGGVILLAGFHFLFRKRAGVVLLHLGVGLLMFSQFMFGRSLEERAQMDEGQSVNYVRDIHKAELAVIDTSGETDRVTVVPLGVLKRDETVQHDDLPFDVSMISFYENTTTPRTKRQVPDDIDSIPDDEPNRGTGLYWEINEAPTSTGSDGSGIVDTPAGIFRISADGEEIGRYLLSTVAARPEPITVGDQTYQVYFRFKRNYKDYTLFLADTERTNYVGTNTPRDYRSIVYLRDADGTVQRSKKIWMNNPLRYGGETMYQSGHFIQSGVETSILQVVTNNGWMIPYVACSVVFIGMLAHFLNVLARFVDRRSRAESTARFSPQTASPYSSSSSQASKGKKKRQQPEAVPATGSNSRVALLAGSIVFVFAIWFASKARPASVSDGGIDYEAFGRLPLMYEGRIKPFDTLARTSLRLITDREEYVDDNGDKQPAIRWLLDVMAREEVAQGHKVFRIQNPDVIDALGLKRRRAKSKDEWIKFHKDRYSLNEIFGEDRSNLGKFAKDIEQIRSIEPQERNRFQRKMLKLDQRLKAYLAVKVAFAPSTPIPYVESFENKSREETEKLLREVMFPKEEYNNMSLHRLAHLEIDSLEEQFKRAHPPLAIPSATGDWKTYAQTSLQIAVAPWDRLTARMSGQEFDDSTKELVEPTRQLAKIFQAYKKSDSVGFRVAVDEYSAMLDEIEPKDLDSTRVGVEFIFNRMSPFYLCMVPYLFAFVLTGIGWLGTVRENEALSKAMHFSSMVLIASTFGVHVSALLIRMYISGRPPVTNLYSSAVFIGVGAVGLGLALERIYKNGFGNCCASIIGFVTLFVAYWLAADGDTLVVLQAVLDTQFWLATHVTCITFGYSTSFFAGMVGATFIVRGWLSKGVPANEEREFGQMIYGITCFSILFSFIGTVLGGLWADDSWGRFWGWDPKENGAMMIVMWNAVMLHARWGGMARTRGMAVLAVIGNIVTAWSWFGVNELGIGLHAYGFTEGRRLYLGLFALSQLFIVGLGSMPKHVWMVNPDAGKTQKPAV